MTQPERTSVCGACIFYQPHPWGDTGECRRYTPSVEGWPHVKPTDWCAEWCGGDPEQPKQPEVVH